MEEGRQEGTQGVRGCESVEVAGPQGARGAGVQRDGLLFRLRCLSGHRSLENFRRFHLVGYLPEYDLDRCRRRVQRCGHSARGSGMVPGTRALLLLDLRAGMGHSPRSLREQVQRPPRQGVRVRLLPRVDVRAGDVGDDRDPLDERRRERTADEQHRDSASIQVDPDLPHGSGGTSVAGDPRADGPHQGARLGEPLGVAHDALVVHRRLPLQCHVQAGHEGHSVGRQVLQVPRGLHV
mmetsp:Transcript_66606/g.192357  ORF Transcript_66606/g.192357 Transcript_66606/m.192357 type:complete len:237 (-) Transcript_66606:767-1477(-)